MQKDDKRGISSFFFGGYVALTVF